MEPAAGHLPFLIVHGALVWKAVLVAFVALVLALGWTVRRVLARRRPEAPRSRVQLPVIAIVAAIVAAIGWKIEGAYGEARGRDCYLDSGHFRRDDPDVDPPVALSNTHACALAAAAPGQRDEALYRARMALEEGTYRDAATLGQILALTELIDGCDAVKDKLLHFERYDEAAAAARRCGDRRAEHIALVLQGKFDEAAALPVSREGRLEMTSDGMRPKLYAALPDPVTLIATGRWKDAASAAEARADALRASASPGDASHATQLTALHYTCVAELFRSYAGDPAAAGRLRALVAGSDGATCVPALLEIATGDERRALFARGEGGSLLQESAALLGSLAWLEGDADRPDSTATIRMFRSPEAVLAQPEGSYFGGATTPRMWLAAIASPALHSVSMASWRAVIHVFDGDLVAAAAAAQEALALAPAGDPRAQIEALVRERAQLTRDLAAMDAELTHKHHPSSKAMDQRGTELQRLQRRADDLEKRQSAIIKNVGDNVGDESHDLFAVALLPALIALHTTSTSATLPALDDKLRDRVRTRYPQLLLRRGEPADDELLRIEPALRSAAAGDGRALAAALGQSIPHWLDHDVMAVLPRITTDRDAVARQLAWAAPPSRPNVDSERFPWNLAIHAVARRDVFRVAGVTDAAARWEAIYHRLAGVLEDHRKLVALLLWRL